MQEQAISIGQAIDCLPEIEAGGKVALRNRMIGRLGEAEHRPPARPQGHPAFVGDDREQPRPHCAELRSDPPAVTPAFQGHLLDGILGSLALAKHRQRETVCGLDQWSQDVLESPPVSKPSLVEQA